LQLREKSQSTCFADGPSPSLVSVQNFTILPAA
jgi:hypothetical protein